MRSIARGIGATTGLLAAFLAVPGVAAHGPAPAEPPTLGGLLLGWTFEPYVALPLAVAVLLWLMAVRRVNAAHPAHPVPRRRSVAFLAGMAAIAVALMSGIDRYDTTLFSIHMVQHVLLILVAAPLIALGAPVTLALRAASPELRRRVLLPILHSRVVRVIGFPPLAWVAFAAVMWGTHLSPVFDAALENEGIHALEHVVYLGVALLFWWPAVALDPSPWRMAYPVRALYVFLQAPQNTFLAVLLFSAPAPIYPHYATVQRSWGPSPLLDQQMAGGIMWLAGDVVFIVAALAILYGWMRHEERETARTERRVDAERAAIREREGRLAERLAREREGQQG